MALPEVRVWQVKWMYRGIVYSEQVAGQIKNAGIEEFLRWKANSAMWRGTGRIRDIDEFASLGNNFHSSLGKLAAVFELLGAREQLRYFAKLNLQVVDPLHIHGRTMRDDGVGALSLLGQF
jgi:hypothetical protein